MCGRGSYVRCKLEGISCTICLSLVKISVCWNTIVLRWEKNITGCTC